MRVTIKDIAKAAGVSTATVSKVINNKTDDIGEETCIKVMKIVEDLNYVPNAFARGIKSKKSKLIGLLIPNINNPFFTEVARGAEDKAFELGYSLFLCNTDENIEKEISYLYALIELQVEGVIIAGSYARNQEKEKELILNTPIVAIDRPLNYKNMITYIKTDNFNISKNLAKTLRDLGYKKCLYLAGPKHNSITEERIYGFSEGFNDQKSSIIEVVYGEFDYEHGYESTIQRTQQGGFDLIACANDLIALGSLGALQEELIDVPETIGVVGFDDIQLASMMKPKLSTVAQPMYDMGRVAVETIVNYVEHKEVDSVIELEQVILLRDTTTALD